MTSGSERIIAAIVSVASVPAKARLPASISYSTQPNAQMSARLSTDFPRACSGLMYAAVPSSTPSPVASAGDVSVGDKDNAAPGRELSAAASPSFASPKSSTLTDPSGRTLMFAGLRSR